MNFLDQKSDTKHLQNLNAFNILNCSTSSIKIFSIFIFIRNIHHHQQVSSTLMIHIFSHFVFDIIIIIIIHCLRGFLIRFVSFFFRTNNSTIFNLNFQVSFFSLFCSIIVFFHCASACQNKKFCPPLSNDVFFSLSHSNLFIFIIIECLNFVEKFSKQKTKQNR